MPEPEINPLRIPLDRTDALIVSAIVLVGIAAVAFAVYQNRQRFVDWRAGWREGMAETADDLGDRLRAEEGITADA